MCKRVLREFVERIDAECFGKMRLGCGKVTQVRENETEVSVSFGVFGFELDYSLELATGMGELFFVSQE